MATKQTRRSISIRGTTYDTLRKYCEQHQRSMSDLVEEQLARLIGGKPARTSVKTAPRARTVAPKIVRAAAPPKPDAVGRPKPVDAREVIPARSHAPEDDYRSITF